MSLKDITVLLIDDDPELRAIVARILSNVGIHIVHAASVSEAFILIKSQRPHLIVTDLNMQPESGFDFLQKFKNDRDVRDIPTLVLSARKDKESIHKAFALGAKEYLAKPLQAQLLLQKVRKLVRATDFTELDFPPDNLPTLSAKIPGTIVGGQENGFQIESPVRLSQDSQITLECTVISPLGFDRDPLVRTGSALPQSNHRNGFVNEIAFMGLQEKQIAVMRSILKKWHTK